MNFRTKMIYFLLASFIGLVSVLFIVFVPAIKDINYISHSIILEKEDLESKYQRGLLLKKIKNTLHGMQEEKITIDQLYIEMGKELEFVDAIEKEASKNNISLTLQLNTKDIVTNRNIQILPIGMILKGDFIQILSYLYELEKQSYYLNISSIDITNTSGGKDNINISLAGKLYSKEYKKDESR